VRDDELALEVSLYLTQNAIRKVVINPQDVPKDLEGKRVDFRFSRPNDFWLYCWRRSARGLAKRGGCWKWESLHFNDRFATGTFEIAGAL
jgi:hypothetical protein